ncbi:MAG: hypothetical protein ONB46_11230 [candidate division KSB1 bacterium]|nr:hypothetical protein [candidate division KSB1 bacterium]MDZ7366341.1 hypothetical protein [candidate division KSB1 bacterium]MDZ7403996.1 hypothetical protein [candidate division KSB1 bacterium]
MIVLEYLLGILFLGFCYFVAIRLKWLYEKTAGHLFWQKPHAKYYHFAAGVLLFAGAAALLLKFHPVYLLLLLFGEYLLIAIPAVKVNERGIMTNAFLARWPDILQARQIKATGEIFVLTKQHWQRIRLKVPADKQAPFRKMLAAKGIQIVVEEAEKNLAPEQMVSPSTENENESRPEPESADLENPA